MIKVLCVNTSEDIYSELGNELHRTFTPTVIKDRFYYASEGATINSLYYNIYYHNNDETYLGKFSKRHFITIDELREIVINKILDND
jgi:hypothetical protein